MAPISVQTDDMIRMLSSHTFSAITKASSHTVQSVSCCEARFLAEGGDLHQFRRQRKNGCPFTVVMVR